MIEPSENGVVLLKSLKSSDTFLVEEKHMADLDHVIRFAFYGCIGSILLVHFFPPIAKSRFGDPLRSIVWGVILTVLACAFVCYEAGNPLHELALIRRAQVATGLLVDTLEDAQEDYRGLHFSDVGVYAFHLPDGREFKTSTRVPTGELEGHVEVEYLPDNPAVNRVKGDGCASVTEVLWRKFGFGSLILVGLCWIPVGLLWKGLKDLKRLCTNPEMPVPDE